MYSIFCYYVSYINSTCIFLKINRSRNIYKILHLNEQILKASLTFE